MRTERGCIPNGEMVLVLRFFSSQVDNIIWQINRPSHATTAWMSEVCTETDERRTAHGTTAAIHIYYIPIIIVCKNIRNIMNNIMYFISTRPMENCKRIYICALCVLCCPKKWQLLRKLWLFNSFWVELSAVSALCHPDRQTDYVGSRTKGKSSTLVGNVRKFDLMKACTRPARITNSNRYVQCK